MSVASASVLTSSPVVAGSTRSSASTPTTRPAAVKNMGAVIHVPSMRCEIAAKTRRTTASATSCQCTGGASQRAPARWQGRFERCPSGMRTSTSTRRSCGPARRAVPRARRDLRATARQRAGTTPSGSSRSGGRFASRAARSPCRSSRASSRCSRDVAPLLPVPVPVPTLRRATERALPVAVLRVPLTAWCRAR